MEKTFTKAIILGATVFTAFMIVIPVGHLQAESEIKIDEKTKMHKATIESIDFKTNTITVTIDGFSIPVPTNASTTVFLGNGEEAQLPALRTGSDVYVFGAYDSESRTLLADKIVLRNKSVLGRKTLSRVEMKANSGNVATDATGVITLGDK